MYSLGVRSLADVAKGVPRNSPSLTATYRFGRYQPGAKVVVHRPYTGADGSHP